MQRKDIKTDLFPNIHYRVSVQGSALVLLHGFPETGELWSDVWDELAKHFFLIIPDMPGAGKSARCTEPLTVELMAQFVKEILDAESILTAVIAGHSMGGYVNMAFAELYPETIQGLIMVHSMAVGDTDEKKEQRRKSIALIEKGGKEVFVRQMIPGLYSETYKKNHQDKLKANIEEAVKQPAMTLTDFYNAMIKRPDRVELLQGATFPMQWLIGKEDTIATPQKVLQQSTLANVNFVKLYPDCAHMGMLEQPELMTKDIISFVKYCYRF